MIESGTIYQFVEEKLPVGAEKLGLIERLFDAFHTSNIDYCHWKSNEHLGASMTGDTDLDILFDCNCRSTLERISTALGFVRFEPVAQKKYNDIEDFIGLDIESGKVVHLHAHFHLTLGEPYLKGYQLNIEKQLLEQRVFDEEFCVYRTSPAQELILLYCRLALKLRNRDRLKLLLNKGTRLSPNLLREYEWLRQQCFNLEINQTSDALFSDSRMKQIFSGPFTKKQLNKLWHLLRNEWKAKRTHPPFVALLTRWRREFLLKMKRKMVTHYHRPIIQKRFHPVNGVVVAVIGADGSGKSTVINNLNATFSKKLDVYPIYFGNGGYVSFSTKLLRLLGKKKPTRGSDPASAYKATVKELPKKQGFLKTLFKCLDALEIAGVKNKNLERMLQAKSKGMMVICDRYPQSQVMGFNDGPQLHSLLQSRNAIFRWMARREGKIFSKFNGTSPDIVFKLVADSKLIESRKPGETPLCLLEKKIAAIVNQRFPENTEVVTIDASRPLEAVLQTVKSKIWNYYTQ